MGRQVKERRYIEEKKGKGTREGGREEELKGAANERELNEDERFVTIKARRIRRIMTLLLRRKKEKMG